MSVNLTYRKAIKIDLDPDEIAYAFFKMDSDEQAIFFNGVQALYGTTGIKLLMQMQFVSDSTYLREEGRRAMQVIGDYSEQVKR